MIVLNASTNKQQQLTYPSPIDTPNLLGIFEILESPMTRMAFVQSHLRFVTVNFLPSFMLKPLKVQTHHAIWH
jgi:hypothetical protein